MEQLRYNIWTDDLPWSQKLRGKKLSRINRNKFQVIIWYNNCMSVCGARVRMIQQRSWLELQTYSWMARTGPPEYSRDVCARPLRNSLGREEAQGTPSPSIYDKLSVDDACAALLSASINKIVRSLLVHTRNAYII